MQIPLRCICTGYLRRCAKVIMMNWKTLIAAMPRCLSALAGFYIGYDILPTCKDMNEVFWKFTFILLPICFVLPLFSSKMPYLNPLLVFVTITFGIGVDAITDKTMDRNLWGIEAIIAQALALPSAAVGGLCGSILSHIIIKRRKAQQDQSSRSLRSG